LGCFSFFFFLCVFLGTLVLTAMFESFNSAFSLVCVHSHSGVAIAALNKPFGFIARYDCIRNVFTGPKIDATLHTEPISSDRISGSGNYVACVCENVASIVSLATGATIFTTSVTNPSTVTPAKIYFCDATDRFVVQHDAGVSVYDVVSSSRPYVLRVLHVKDASVPSLIMRPPLCADPTGKFIPMVRAGTLFLANTVTQKIECTFKNASHFCFSPSGNRVAVITTDKILVVRSLAKTRSASAAAQGSSEEGNTQQCVTVRSAEATSIRFSRDSQKLFCQSVSYPNVCRVMDLSRMLACGQVCVRDYPMCNAVTFESCCRRFIFCDVPDFLDFNGQASVYMTDLRTGKEYTMQMESSVVGIVQSRNNIIILCEHGVYKLKSSSFFTVRAFHGHRAVSRCLSVP
jgi:hypothetical protein